MAFSKITLATVDVDVELSDNVFQRDAGFASDANLFCRDDVVTGGNAS